MIQINKEEDALDISVVIPVYKEAKNIIPFLNRTIPILEKLVNKKYEVLFTLDPSPDNTEEVIKQQIESNPSDLDVL